MQANDAVALPTITKLTGSGVLAQLYTSYQFKEYLSFFGSIGGFHGDIYLIDPHQISKGHQISRGYTGSLGSIFIFPVIEKFIQPSFRLSTTRLETTTNSYFWGNTYFSKVKCHQQTVDPALRLSFLSFNNIVPYVEYAPHWIMDTSHSIEKTPHKRWGETFTVGGTMTPMDHYQIGFFYSRNTLTVLSGDGFFAPGSQDYFVLKISRGF